MGQAGKGEEISVPSHPRVSEDGLWSPKVWLGFWLLVI